MPFFFPGKVNLLTQGKNTHKAHREVYLVPEEVDKFFDKIVKGFISENWKKN